MLSHACHIRNLHFVCEFKRCKNAKDKKHSMSALLGKVVEDSGMVKLFEKSKLIQEYKIIGNDSILLMSTSKRSPKQENKFFLVKNKKF